MSTTKPFTGFANRGNRSSANGSLGFKPGEMVKIEGIFQDGKTAPFMLDKHGHVSVCGGELFYGSNTKKQKGWFSAKSVDISYKHGNEASAMAKSLATMKSFNSKERLAVKEAMSKLTTYRQLSYVLLEIIRKGSRKSMVKAATCKQDENATIEVEHIEEVKAAVQQSHMMEILHGDHHRDIEENIQAANTYPALAKALLAFIQCYSTIVDEVHATVQDVIADKDSTSPKPTYKGRKVVSEEPKVNDEPEPLATVLKSQHIRINASIAHFPHASAPIRKLAARQAATATTVAHLVDISLLFLQKVIEGTETAISRYEDSLKKIKFTAEKAEGYVDNELGVSDECTMTECLILREIALGMPQLSNREIAASHPRHHLDQT
eukprot:Stramenopile-MAST_4_protein_2512